MTTYDAFLAAIIADPDNDDLRLVFADELEQDGQVERTEFIRVQCAIAKLDGGIKKYAPYLGPEIVTVPPGLPQLRRREQELLAENWTDWDGLPSDRLIRCLNLTGENPGDGIAIRFRRGFVSEVRTTLAAWCGGKCRECNGVGAGVYGLEETEWACQVCEGTGQVEGIGPDVVKGQPVEVVTLTDREPAKYSAQDGMWGWYCTVGEETSPEDMPFWLPPRLFAHLSAGARTAYGTPETGRRYKTKAAARAALSAAALGWAKGMEKGLPFTVKTLRV